MMLDRIHVDRPAVHGEAARRHLLEQEILRRMLLSAQRRQADQILRQLHLVGKARRHRCDDLILQFGVEIEGHGGRSLFAGELIGGADQLVQDAGLVEGVAGIVDHVELRLRPGAV